jgi:hypothetical protein
VKRNVVPFLSHELEFVNWNGTYPFFMTSQFVSRDDVLEVLGGVIALQQAFEFAITVGLAAQDSPIPNTLESWLWNRSYVLSQLFSVNAAIHRDHDPSAIGSLANLDDHQKSQYTAMLNSMTQSDSVSAEVIDTAFEQLNVPPDPLVQQWLSNEKLLLKKSVGHDGFRQIARLLQFSFTKNVNDLADAESPVGGVDMTSMTIDQTGQTFTAMDSIDQPFKVIESLVPVIRSVTRVTQVQP